MKVVAVVQARMGSSRLPGKVLRELHHRPLLSYMIARIRRAETINEIVVATTDLPTDDVLAQWCTAEGIAVYRGSEADVLDRVTRAAEMMEAELVVRLTADCPLLDSAVIDTVVTEFMREYPGIDYVTNGLAPSYPRGMDVEVVSLATLQVVAAMATRVADREHVTPYLYREGSGYRIKNVTATEAMPAYRLTVDTEEDFLLVEQVYRLLEYQDDATLADICAVLAENPRLLDINRHIVQKGLEES